MNERIEKFARECGAWNQVYGNRTFMIDEHFDIEKFAELIVKETLQVARAGIEFGDGMEDAVYKYFGVEE